MGPFRYLLAAIFLLGLLGRGAGRGPYLAIAVLAGLTSFWLYLR